MQHGANGVPGLFQHRFNMRRMDEKKLPRSAARPFKPLFFTGCPHPQAGQFGTPGVVVGAGLAEPERDQGPLKTEQLVRMVHHTFACRDQIGKERALPRRGTAVRNESRHLGDVEEPDGALDPVHTESG